MSRQAREKSPSGLYHIVAGSKDNLKMFYTDEDYEQFIATLLRYEEECGFKLHAYCLLGNHFHILIELETGLNTIMKKLINSYVYYYNNRYLNKEPLLRDRYKSEIISGRGEYLSVVRHIYNSPERAGLCTALEYKWSSAGKVGFAVYDGEEDRLRHIDVPDYKKFSDEEIEYYLTELREQLEANSFSGDELLMLSLGRLNEFGASVRQLARVTGFNRGKVWRLLGKYQKYRRP